MFGARGLCECRWWDSRRSLGVLPRTQCCRWRGEEAALDLEGLVGAVSLWAGEGGRVPGWLGGSGDVPARPLTTQSLEPQKAQCWRPGETPRPPLVSDLVLSFQLLAPSPPPSARVASRTLWGHVLEAREAQRASFSVSWCLRAMPHVLREGAGLTLAEDAHRPRGLSCFPDGCTSCGAAPCRSRAGTQPSWDSRSG